MRDAFGRKVAELRARESFSLRSFSKAVGISPSQLSNIENGREAISDRVLNAYLRQFNLSECEAQELEQLAKLSSARRVELIQGTAPQIVDLVAILRLFGADLSGDAVKKFRLELERNLGISASALFLQIGNRQAGRAKRERETRAKMLPTRMASLAWLGSQIRRKRFDDYSKAVIDVFLDLLASSDLLFNYEIVERMPDRQADAFAYLQKEGDGFTLYLAEKLFLKAASDPYYRYVVAHEVAHYILHRELFQNGAESIPLPSAKKLSTGPQEKNLLEIIESLPELDADTLAVFILIPWERFLTGLTFSELADDYHVDASKVETIGRIFRNKSVYEELAFVLWGLEIRDHKIFDVLPNMN